MRIEEIGAATLVNGDCREVMRSMDENSIDAIVTDPPYGLGFMGKGWDHGVPDKEFWVEALRVAKPGAHLLAFGGSRTFHRLMVAIEDAGWEIRDTIMWVYGSGFPKGAALDGDWKGWNTALKPAYEPVVVARKPLGGTVAANVLAHGTGAINIAGCRVGDEVLPALTGGQARIGTFERSSVMVTPERVGRWPTNLIHDGSDEVLALFPDSGGSAARFFKECTPNEIELLFCRAEAILEAWTPNFVRTVGARLPLSKSLADSVLNDVVTLVSRGGRVLNNMMGLSTAVTPIELKRISEALITAMLCIERKPLPDLSLGVLIPNGCHVRSAETRAPIDTTIITISQWKSDGSVGDVTFNITPPNWGHGGKGSANRFKYCAKASRKDRNEGLDDPGVQFKHGDTLRKIENTDKRGNTHPTVKPTDLMRYLCRLVTPPGGTVLDPFMGSGSTGKAALREGFGFVGIDNDEEQGYFDIACARVKAATLPE